MKILRACLAILLFCQSCGTKKENRKELKSFFSKCDELNIIYYSKDTFVFKTIDTSTINNFTELITGDNDNYLSSSNPRVEEELIYKSKGKIFFTAFVFNYYEENGNISKNVSHILQKKTRKHLLTYRVGMGISEIYEHKVNPNGSPWTHVDTTKSYYEDFKNNR